MIRIYSFALILLSIVSCKKAENRAFNDPFNTPIAKENYPFPNIAGDYWEYDFLSSGLKIPQTILLEVTGDTTNKSGNQSNTWLTKLNNPQSTYPLRYRIIDTSLVVSDAKSAVFYPAPNPNAFQFYIKKQFKFPLVVNNYWLSNSTFGDTTKVLSVGSLTVPAGTFQNTFQLSNTQTYLNNASIKDTIWFTPNIGIVKFVQNEFTDGQPAYGNGTWELKSYVLK